MPPDPTRTALIEKLKEAAEYLRCRHVPATLGDMADACLEAASLLAGEGLTQEKEKDQELGLLGTAAGADSSEPAPRRED